MLLVDTHADYDIFEFVNLLFKELVLSFVELETRLMAVG